ncbi:MAG: phytoene/squalene synthase family protein [Planctomycetota bacterium]
MSEAATVIRQNSRSFSLAARLIPRRIREDVVCLYAWCRSVDDAVDHAASREEAERELSILKSDVEAIAARRPTRHPASDWLRPLIVEKGVEPAHAVELIEGMELDLHQFEVRTFGDLRRYCYHAAGTVGLMMSRLMGVRDPAAEPAAISLGVGMQMTNIVRDVLEDAQRDRSYLPGLSARMVRGSINVDSAQSEDARAIRQVVIEIVAEAEKEYERAISGIHFLPRDCRRAIQLALVFYREIHRESVRRDLPVLRERVIVPRWRLVWIALPVVLLNRVSFWPGHRTDDSWREQFNAATGNVSFPFEVEPKMSKRNIAQSKHAVYLGLSLTAIMATVLFVLVYVNPKQDAYGSAPLIYAGISGVIALMTNRLAAKQENAIAE